MTGYKNGDSVGHSDVLTCGIVDSSYRYQFQQLQSGTEIRSLLDKCSRDPCWINAVEITVYLILWDNYFVFFVLFFSKRNGSAHGLGGIISVLYTARF